LESVEQSNIMVFPLLEKPSLIQLSANAHAVIRKHFYRIG